MVTVRFLDELRVQVDYTDVGSEKPVLREFTMCPPRIGDGVGFKVDGVDRFWRVVEIIRVINPDRKRAALSVGLREVSLNGEFK